MNNWRKEGWLQVRLSFHLSHLLHCICFPCTLGYCVITGLSYQNRIAIKFLEELATEFKPALGKEALKAKENGLNVKGKKMLTAMCTKYETPEGVDSASRVIAQVEGVKSQMADNIAGMLKNQESAESLNQKSGELAEQANVFKKNSKQLKNTMRWKNLKMTLLLGGVVLVVGTIILLPLLSNLGILFSAVGGGGGGDDEDDKHGKHHKHKGGD